MGQPFTLTFGSRSMWAIRCPWDCGEAHFRNLEPKSAQPRFRAMPFTYDKKQKHAKASIFSKNFLMPVSWRLGGGICTSSRSFTVDYLPSPINPPLFLVLLLSFSASLPPGHAEILAVPAPFSNFQLVCHARLPLRRREAIA